MNFIVVSFRFYSLTEMNSEFVLLQCLSATIYPAVPWCPSVCLTLWKPSASILSVAGFFRLVGQSECVCVHACVCVCALHVSQRVCVYLSKSVWCVCSSYCVCVCVPRVCLSYYVCVCVSHTRAVSLGTPENSAIQKLPIIIIMYVAP